MESEGNFGRDQETPTWETLSALCQPCLKEFIYFNVRGALDEGLASENKNHHARGSAQKINQFQGSQ